MEIVPKLILLQANDYGNITTSLADILVEVYISCGASALCALPRYIASVLSNSAWKKGPYLMYRT